MGMFLSIKGTCTVVKVHPDLEYLFTDRLFSIEKIFLLFCIMFYDAYSFLYKRRNTTGLWTPDPFFLVVISKEVKPLSTFF